MGVVEPRAGRTGGNVKDLPDLVQAQPEVVMEHEDRPLLGRQPPEPALDLVSIREQGELIRSCRSIDRQGPNGGDPGALAARLGVAGVDERPLEPGIEGPLEGRVGDPSIGRTRMDEIQARLLRASV